MAGHSGASSQRRIPQADQTRLSANVTRIPQAKIPASVTEAHPELVVAATTETSSTHTETEAAVASPADESSYFSNVTEVRSMRMVEIPRSKGMLLSLLDVDATADEAPTDETFALEKIIRTLRGDAKSSSLERDAYTSVDPTYPTPLGTIDDSSERPSPMPVSADSILDRPRSRSNDKHGDNESTRIGVRSKLRLVDGSIPGIVKVRMQNTSVIESGATRLIYSVHLDGKPVPAETAARDMALLSPQEVALELGAPVIIQSERERTII